MRPQAWRALTIVVHFQCAARRVEAEWKPSTRSSNAASRACGLDKSVRWPFVFSRRAGASHLRGGNPEVDEDVEEAGAEGCWGATSQPKSGEELVNFVRLILFDAGA